MRPLLFVPLVALLQGCPERQAVPAPRDAGRPTEVAALDAGGPLDALEREVSAVLRRSCTPCHDWTPWGLVRLRSVCREGGALVVPFQPEASPLYLKVSGRPVCGAPMPPAGALPPGATQALRAWIQAGAPVSGRVSPRLEVAPPSEPEDWAPDPN